MKDRRRKNLHSDVKSCDEGGMGAVRLKGRARNKSQVADAKRGETTKES